MKAAGENVVERGSRLHGKGQNESGKRRSGGGVSSSLHDDQHKTYLALSLSFPDLPNLQKAVPRCDQVADDLAVRSSEADAESVRRPSR